ncbi:MAG: hypothetical protein DMG13_07660 [Acidobacteria bacterium]|nr:MAG: hypothetical protein DMG13_07660 [Acidobacteriota bacterium]
MSRHRKHKPLPPRHTRLRRSGRLQAAKAWMASYSGKNIVRGYRKHFAVDSICALRELGMLGVAIDPAYEKALMATVEGQRKRNSQKKQHRIAQESAVMPEEDPWGLPYIAGFTEQAWADRPATHRIPPVAGRWARRARREPMEWQVTDEEWEPLDDTAELPPGCETLNSCDDEIPF